MLVGAGTDEVQRSAIGIGTLVHEPGDFHLGHALGHSVETAAAQLGRDFIEQGFDAGCVNGAKHLFDVGFGMRDKRHGGVRNQAGTARLRGSVLSVRRAAMPRRREDYSSAMALA